MATPKTQTITVPIAVRYDVTEMRAAAARLLAAADLLDPQCEPARPWCHATLGDGTPVTLTFYSSITESGDPAHSRMLYLLERGHLPTDMSPESTIFD